MIKPIICIEKKYFVNNNVAFRRLFDTKKVQVRPNVARIVLGS